MYGLSVPTQMKTEESHVFSLPTEVLEEVLFRCLPPAGPPAAVLCCERREELYSYPHQVRNTLEMVCSRWSTTIKQAPRMWSKFLIDSKTLHVLRTRPDILRLWLDRSGQYPLDLYLDTSLEEDRKIRRLFIKIFEPEISRIRVLTLNIAVEFNRATYFLINNVQLAPMMEQLYLVWDMGLNFTRHEAFHAPRLTKLTLLLEAAGFLFCLTKQCLQSLRHLTIQLSQTPLTAYFDCLASCINLEELAIGAADFSDQSWFSEDSYYPSIVLPSVKKLTWGLPSGSFCQAMVLPNLKTFHAFEEYFYGSASEVLNWFLRKKMLTLTEVFIPGIPGKLIVDMSRCIPNLRTLMVNDWCYETAEILNLLFPPDAAPPFPYLRNLHVFLYNHDGDKDAYEGEEDERGKENDMTDHDCHEYLVRHIQRLTASENQIHVPEHGQFSILHIHYAGMPNYALLRMTTIHRDSCWHTRLADYNGIVDVLR